MIWASWQDFFDMGGRGLYVWGSVIVCFVCMGAELGQVQARWKAIRTTILRKMGHEGKA